MRFWVCIFGALLDVMLAVATHAAQLHQVSMLFLACAGVFVVGAAIDHLGTE